MILNSFKKRPVCILCLLFVGVMFLADWLGFPLVRGNPLPKPLKEWIQEHPQATVCGTVKKSEDTEFSQSIYLNNTYLIYQSEKISIENVKVYMSEKEEVPVGAVIVVSGRLESLRQARNAGGFDSAAYYACQHIYYQMKSARIQEISKEYSWYGEFLAKIKEKLSDILEETAGTDAPIFQAMLLGDKTDLDKEIRTLYQMSGIIHILAISGLHISMLGMGVYQGLKRMGLGIWCSGFLALLLMIQYGVMTGSSVSTIRAVCMFLLNVGAKMLGRVYDMPTALSLAAILVLMESPAYLYSSSFQLSFAAVIGIGVITPVVQENLKIKHKWFRNLISSFVVQMVTLPIVLTAYGEVSVVGILLNLIVLPTVGVILGCGVLGCAVGMIWTGGAEILLIPGRVLLWGYEKLCLISVGIPFAVWIPGAPKVWQICVYYGVLAVVLITANFAGRPAEGKFAIGSEGSFLHQSSAGVSMKRRWFSGKRKLWFIRLWTAAGGITGLFILGYRENNPLEITCLDVGQGDCIVLESEADGNFLIDCGSTSQSEVGQYCLFPFLKNQGISYLDGIFVSHTDKDHISGIEELLTTISDKFTAIQVGSLILPAWEEKDEAYQELEKLAQAADVTVVYVNEGDMLYAGEICVEVLRPERGSSGSDTNEDGMVLQVKQDEFCGLFMGDVGETVEKELLSILNEVDFLKVGHHGSKYSTSGEFLEVISPEVAVISCSEDNSYGHPAQETVKRLEQSGCQVEYTMKNGMITLVWDGEKVEVERFMK